MSRSSTGPDRAEEGEASDLLGRVEVVVSYLVVPPTLLLGGIYGATQVLDASFGNAVFWLTMLALGTWVLTFGSIQTGAVGGSGGQRIINQTITHRGTTGTDMEGEEFSDGGERAGAVRRYFAADLLAPRYLQLILTLAVFLGWAVVLVDAP